MTSIDFYFNAADRLQVACRLAGKALAERKRLLVYAPDADVASRLDRLLWTWPAIAFVPHCAAHDPLAPDTPVLISRDENAPADIAVLLNLASEAPPHFASFERLLEIVGGGEAEREAARARYRLYKSRGYAIANHDLGGNDA
jgi:DNA polymerase-3 subunit chi